MRVHKSAEYIRRNGFRVQIENTNTHFQNKQTKTIIFSKTYDNVGI